MGRDAQCSRLLPHMVTNLIHVALREGGREDRFDLASIKGFDNGVLDIANVLLLRGYWFVLRAPGRQDADDDIDNSEFDSGSDADDLSDTQDDTLEHLAGEESE